MTQPKLYIIAGCNGAGKTTASKNVLPELLNCNKFVNADEIAHEINPENVEAAAMKAGRIMLTQIQELLRSKATFSIETTLATKSYHKVVKQAQELGYSVILLFFWLETPQLAKMRVKQRVLEGGHNIPDDVIIRRYWRGINNLFEVFMPIVNAWAVYDNRSETRLIANSDGVINESVWFEIMRRMEERERLELWDKLNAGLEKSYEKMLREKIEKNQPVIISEDGIPKAVPAEEAMRRLILDLKLRKEGLL